MKLKKFSICSWLVSLVICLLMSNFSANAVLKEKDLENTLKILCAELESNYKQQKAQIALYNQYTKIQHEQLIELMQKCEQISLMLYSQKSEFTFDLAYTCQEATNLYKKMNVKNLPYSKIRIYLRYEITRYDALIKTLEQLPPATGNAKIKMKLKLDSIEESKLLQEKNNKNIENQLISLDSDIDSLRHKLTNSPFYLNEELQKDRERCLVYSKALRNNMMRLNNSLVKDSEYYNQVTSQVKELNDYAIERYQDLQANIFINPGDDYYTILKNIDLHYLDAKQDINDKYDYIYYKKTKSDWRGPIIYGTILFILFYIFISALISNVLLRWLLPRNLKQYDFYKEKKNILVFTCGIFIFAISIGIAKIFLDQNFIIMATSMMIYLAWLTFTILFSLLIRLDSKQLKTGIKVYTPFLVMAFLVIIFRIIFIPNTLINLIYPPILIIFTIWQIITLRKRSIKIPESDVVYSLISLTAMILASILSCVGYTLLAVEIMIWWNLQLASIQTITCLYYLCNIYEEKYIFKRLKENLHINIDNAEEVKKNIAKGVYINQTWTFDFFKYCIIPLLATYSFLLSIYIAAEIFDMTEICKTIFYYNFVDKQNMIQLSVSKIYIVVSLFFVFRFIKYIIKSFYISYRKKHFNNNQNITLALNIISILVWGAYFIYCLILLQVPNSGISLITAGLATGLGFAMKDILENFIYGLSLMTGRVRVGDYIECDGIYGKVESITYQSTQITTLDGSIIAFLNSALFTKNFKNLTRNHNYVLVKIPIGVAYGVNIDRVREVLIPELNKLNYKTATGNNIINEKGFAVIFNDFGDSSVDLFVTYWVIVEEKGIFAAKVKEVIYNTLTKNNIEIPFPQCDIHIRDTVNLPISK